MTDDQLRTGDLGEQLLSNEWSWEPKWTLASGEGLSAARLR